MRVINQKYDESVESRETDAKGLPGERLRDLPPRRVGERERPRRDGDATVVTVPRRGGMRRRAPCQPARSCPSI